MMPLRNTPADMSGTLFLLLTLTFFIIFIMFSGCVQKDVENKSEDAAKDVMKPPPVEPLEKPKGTVKERSWRWMVEDGLRIKDGSVPYAMRLDDGRVRLYYCSAGGISSAISEDGLEFKKEQGTRISGGQGGESIICDPTVVRIDDGMRMYYKGADGPGGPGEAVHRIYSAISRHGLSWKKEGVRIESLKTSDRGWASVPEAVKLPDGSVRLYYVSNEGPHGIATAISKDGLSFERESGIILPDLVDPSVLIKNGSYFMFATSIEPRYLPQGIYMLTSHDGRNFQLDKKPIIEAPQEKGVFDPAALLLKDGSIRLYYGEYSPQGMVIKSAIGRIE